MILEGDAGFSKETSAAMSSSRRDVCLAARGVKVFVWCSKDSRMSPSMSAMGSTSLPSAIARSFRRLPNDGNRSKTDFFEYPPSQLLC